MKSLLCFWLLAGCAYAQVPEKTFRRDTLPVMFSPDNMPVTRPNNSFYRYQVDPNTVMRAATDNMPVSVPDSSVRYAMKQRYQRHRQAPESPLPILPMPRIRPEKVR